MWLLKILILLPSVWLFNASCTAPNSPPEESERAYGAFYEYQICPTVLPILFPLFASVPFVVELAVVIAAHFPSTLSSEFLSRLVLSGQLPSSAVNRYFIAGSIFVVIGGLGRLWCFRTLGRFFTFHLAIRKDHQLITTGPYAIVRHPSHPCLLLSTCGMSLMMASPGSFMRQCGWLETMLGKLFLGVWVAQNLLLWVLAFVRCPREDELLRGRFREEWERYSERVIYRMIPGVY